MLYLSVYLKMRRTAGGHVLYCSQCKPRMSLSDMDTGIAFSFRSSDKKNTNINRTRASTYIILCDISREEIIIIDSNKTHNASF